MADVPSLVAMPPATILTIRRFPELAIVLASWRGGESIHGRLIEEGGAGVTLECAGVTFVVPRPAAEGVEGG